MWNAGYLQVSTVGVSGWSGRLIQNAEWVFELRVTANSHSQIRNPHFVAHPLTRTVLTCWYPAFRNRPSPFPVKLHSVFELDADLSFALSVIQMCDRLGDSEETMDISVERIGEQHPGNLERRYSRRRNV